jgi:hypothetical protein
VEGICVGIGIWRGEVLVFVKSQERGEGGIRGSSKNL